MRSKCGFNGWKLVELWLRKGIMLLGDFSVISFFFFFFTFMMSDVHF